MCASALTATLLLSGCGVFNYVSPIKFNGTPTLASIFTPSSDAADYGQAIKRFSDMHEATPEDLSVLIGLARNLLYSGDAQAALAVLGDSAEQFSEASDYQTELGKTRLAAGDIVGAQGSLEKAVAIDRNNWRAYAALGVVYDMKRTFRKAKIAYEKAFKACPSSISLRNNMAISAGMSGNPRKALSILRTLGKEVPSEPVVAENIDLFERMKRDCATCSSKAYQAIASSIFTPGPNSISDNMVCDVTKPESKPEAKPEMEPIVQAIEENNFVDVRIQFLFDSAVLTASALPMLDEVAAAITSQRLNIYRFAIEGHTDARGTDKYNQALSELRAQAVKLYLVEIREIDHKRFDIIGYGEQHLLDASTPEAGINRRVRITRLGKIN